MTFELIKPSIDRLASYVAALKSHWSPDNVRGEEVAREHIAAVAKDPAAFVESLDDPGGRGGPLILPDGSTVPRLPSVRRWAWDGDFVGSFGLRWQADGSALPEHVLGHIGFSIVPWKRERGYATRGLALMLDEARQRGLSYVELTADPDNEPSQKVMLANGGVLLGRFPKVDAYGGGESLRYRIEL